MKTWNENSQYLAENSYPSGEKTASDFCREKMRLMVGMLIIPPHAATGINFACTRPPLPSLVHAFLLAASSPPPPKCRPPPFLQLGVPPPPSSPLFPAGESFFTVGGHSLLATDLAGRLGVDLLRGLAASP